MVMFMLFICKQEEPETPIMAAYSYRGVEYEFVDTDKRYLDELKCPICLELVCDPLQTSCGHIFCGKCITETQTCPVDREQFTFHKDNYNDRRVCNFKVKCPNKRRGCQWQGDLGGATRHTDVNCDYQIVECDNKGCVVKMERRHLVHHKNNECPQRMTKCPHCSKEDTLHNLKERKTHYTICDDMPLPCPSGCGRRGLVRRNMAQHLSTECLEELVACTYVIAGCQEVVKRKDLQQHLQEKDQHIDTILTSYSSMSQLLRDLAYAAKCGSHNNTQASLLPIAFRPWHQSTPTCYPRAPCVIEMGGIREKMEKKAEWFSHPVYSHFGGYKMCLKVSMNGISKGGHAYLCILIYWMKGDNDVNLNWPFKGTIKVSLLNQLENGQHCTKMLWAPDDDTPEDCCSHVTGRERGQRTGWGYSHFISHQDLGYCGTEKHQFLKDDTLFFRVDSFETKLD